MSIEISHKTEARLTDEARRQGVSVDALIERFISELSAPAHLASNGSTPNVPVLHLGAMGSLRRSDLYDDVG